MPEAGYIPIPRKLARAGVKDLLRISDGRMSGTASGAVVLHVAPEAAAGGPLAIIRDGDRIKLDVESRTLNVLIDDEEIRKRLDVWKRGPQVEAVERSKQERGYRGLLQTQRTSGRQGSRFRLPDRLNASKTVEQYDKGTILGTLLDQASIEDEERPRVLPDISGTSRLGPLFSCHLCHFGFDQARLAPSVLASTLARACRHVNWLTVASRLSEYISCTSTVSTSDTMSVALTSDRSNAPKSEGLITALPIGRGMAIQHADPDTCFTAR